MTETIESLMSRNTYNDGEVDTGLWRESVERYRKARDRAQREAWLEYHREMILRIERTADVLVRRHEAALLELVD